MLPICDGWFLIVSNLGDFEATADQGTGTAGVPPASNLDSRRSGEALAVPDLTSFQTGSYRVGVDTRVPIPSSLLSLVDKRAEELGLSRNRYIVQVLERSLEGETNWSPAFIEQLEAAHQDEECRETLEEMRRVIASSRQSKTSPIR